MKNNRKEALRNLEKAIELGGYTYIEFANIIPVFDNIRNEAEFIKLISTSK